MDRALGIGAAVVATGAAVVGLGLLWKRYGPDISLSKAAAAEVPRVNLGAPAVRKVAEAVSEAAAGKEA